MYPYAAAPFTTYPPFMPPYPMAVFGQNAPAVPAAPVEPSMWEKFKAKLSEENQTLHVKNSTILAVAAVAGGLIYVANR